MTMSQTTTFSIGNICCIIEVCKIINGDGLNVRIWGQYYNDCPNGLCVIITVAECYYERGICCLIINVIECCQVSGWCMLWWEQFGWGGMLVGWVWQ